MACDPDLLIAYHKYSDSNCKNKQTPALDAWYITDACKPALDGIWYKVTNVELTGNKFGIGWREGVQIFVCQTILFGVCAGYQ